MGNTMVSSGDGGNFEQGDGIKQFQPRKIRGKKTTSGEMDYRIVITDAIKFMRLTKTEVGRISFRMDPADVEGEEGDRMIPCYYFSSDSVPDGRESDLYRVVRMNKQPSGSISYQLMLPHSVLDSLGYDTEDCCGEIINLYATENGLLALGEVETREIQTHLDPSSRDN